MSDPKSKTPERPYQHKFIYECVTCGIKETDFMYSDKPRRDETIRLVRCSDCTRKGIPLPAREGVLA